MPKQLVCVCSLCLIASRDGGSDLFTMPSLLGSSSVVLPPVTAADVWMALSVLF